MSEPPARGSEVLLGPDSGPVAVGLQETGDVREQVPTLRAPRSLPSAASIVSRGLSAAAGSSAELRRASVYFGLLVAALCAPAVLHLLAAEEETGVVSSADSPFGLLVIIAGLGLGVVAVEIAGVANAMLGGRVAGRPVSLRLALVRSRAVFWRLAGAAVAVGIVAGIVRWLLNLVDPVLFDPTSETASLVSAVITSPFAYAQAGIVLGDVDAVAALRRSLSLTRARPSYAVAIALFALVATIIQVFAVGAGLEVLGRLEEILKIDFGTATGLIVLLVVAVVALVAAGSLLFTIAALQAAPQVVGFLVLTGYTGALDRLVAPDAAAVGPSAGGPRSAEPGIGRDAGGGGTAVESGTPVPAPAATSGWAEQARRPAPRFRWVTLPMAAAIAVGIVVLAIAPIRY